MVKKIFNDYGIICIPFIILILSIIVSIIGKIFLVDDTIITYIRQFLGGIILPLSLIILIIKNLIKSKKNNYNKDRHMKYVYYFGYFIFLPFSILIFIMGIFYFMQLCQE